MGYTSTVGVDSSSSHSHNPLIILPTPQLPPAGRSACV